MRERLPIAVGLILIAASFLLVLAWPWLTHRTSPWLPAEVTSGFGNVRVQLVWSDDGSPVRGQVATLRLVGDDGQTPTEVVFRQPVDDNGTADFKRIPIGWYWMNVDVYRDYQPRTSTDTGPIEVYPMAESRQGTLRVLQLMKLDLRPIAPARNDVVDVRPEFRWEPYPGAVRYEVNINGGKGSGTYFTTATTWLPSESLEPGRGYFWVVYAHDSRGVVIARTQFANPFTVASR